MISDNNEPMESPFNCKDRNNLYFHSAKDGQKARALANNPNVSVALWGG